jgi:hypothetical protein
MQDNRERNSRLSYAVNLWMSSDKVWIYPSFWTRSPASYRSRQRHAPELASRQLIRDFQQPTFLAAIGSEEAVELVRADADASDAASLKFTPMVFINGKSIDVGQ